MPLRYDILDLLLGSILTYSIPILYFIWAINYTSKKMWKLSSYARSLLDRDVSEERKPWTILVSSLVIWVSIILLYSSLEGVPQFFTEHLMAQAYILLVFSYFISVYITSMLDIYRMGNLPLRLKPYTEDKTLGLRPFGQASLQLTAVLLGFAFGLSLVTVAFGSLTTGDIILNGGVVLIGAIMFFVPLLSIRRKLQEAKRAELQWIVPKHTEIIAQLKSESGREKSQQSGD